MDRNKIEQYQKSYKVKQQKVSNFLEKCKNWAIVVYGALGPILLIIWLLAISSDKYHIDIAGLTITLILFFSATFTVNIALDKLDTLGFQIPLKLNLTIKILTLMFVSALTLAVFIGILIALLKAPVKPSIGTTLLFTFFLACCYFAAKKIYVDIKVIRQKIGQQNA